MASPFAFDDDDEKPKKKTRRPGEDDDDQDDEPPKKPVAKAKPKPPVDEDEVEEEDRPRPQKKPAKTVDEDEEKDKDDYEDERPKKKGKTKKKSKLPLILGLVAGVLLLGCCGGGAILDYTVTHVILGSGGARDAFLSYQSAVKAERWGDAYDLMDKASQDDVGKTNKTGKTGKEGFVEMMKDPFMGGIFKYSVTGTIESVTETGDKATVKFKLDPSAQGGVAKLPKIAGMDFTTYTHNMVKENGKWKIVTNKGGI